jgi:hypothetical protein
VAGAQRSGCVKEAVFQVQLLTLPGSWDTEGGQGSDCTTVPCVSVLTGKSGRTQCK